MFQRTDPRGSNVLKIDTTVQAAKIKTPAERLGELFPTWSDFQVALENGEGDALGKLVCSHVGNNISQMTAEDLEGARNTGALYTRVTVLERSKQILDLYLEVVKSPKFETSRREPLPPFMRRADG